MTTSQPSEDTLPAPAGPDGRQPRDGGGRWLSAIRIIQGGMGVAISGWRLARAVAAHAGCLGVVSGTCIDTVVARRLQDGDAGAHIRQAMEAFPDQEVAGRVLDRFFIPGGRAPGAGYRRAGMHSHVERPHLRDLTVLAAFVEVSLARQGHRGPIGINLLTKVRPPTLPTLYGAMLAGVDCVLMGAGIPREIPGALDALATGREAVLKLQDGPAPVEPAPTLRFDPARVPYGAAQLARPAFLPIVSAASLAAMLIRRSTGRVDGFIVEGPTAGGHNAPPRGQLVLDATGQPVYGERDVADAGRMRELGLPFWLAGGTGSPEALAAALAAGATGVQVGTLFAYSRESGMAPAIRRQVIAAARNGGAEVRTDMRSSSTGFPFKVVQLDGTVARPEVYAARPRVCDAGYLREPVRVEDGRLGYRCAAEPVAGFVAKGGTVAETVERRCLCNGLLATAGFAQVQRDGTVEPPIVTSGDDLARLGALIPSGRDDYGADDVIRYLTGASPAL
ncbi:MAG TPA: nitronate monooxygenase [Candidatus Binatia bacterium]|nr:nitronate monooxygenase [Candidatus Binatia bacterium]